MIEPAALIAFLRDYAAPERCAVVLCGSATRDQDIVPGDIDTVVVTNGSWIQRSKERWNNVVLDIQVGPYWYYIDRLRREQQPGLISMFATGRVVAECDGLGESVRHVALDLYEKGPPVTPFEAFHQRQRAGALIGRARRYVAASPQIAQAALLDALTMILHLGARAENRWFEAFHIDFLRMSRSGPMASLLRSIDFSDIGAAADKVERLLEIVTGESLESSLLTSTPRIKLIP